jgi:hypothetical protein
MPTPGTFAKAASYKWYNEVNQVIMKIYQEQYQAQQRQRQGGLQY